MNERMRKRPLAKLAEQSAHHKSYMFRHVIPLCHHLHTIRTDMALFVLLVIIIQCIFCGYLPADRPTSLSTERPANAYVFFFFPMRILSLCFVSYSCIFIALFCMLIMSALLLDLRYGNDADERCDRRAQSLDVAQMLQVGIVRFAKYLRLNRNLI